MFGWAGDDREIADTEQRHLQGAGNGGSRQGKDIDLGLDLLNLLLVADPEPMLLVNDEQAQIVINHIFGEQAMSADDNIDLTGGQLLDDPPLIGSTAKAVDTFNGHWKTGHSFLKGLGMLLGQHRRRHQDSHLTPIFHHLEGGPHRNFSLAIPNITANQTVHRLLGSEVVNGFGNSLVLASSFIIGKGLFKLMKQLAGRRNVGPAAFPAGRRW